jgi:ketosteroid isomerase-like protein
VAAARVPSDPGAFVAATAEAINGFDLDAVVAIYSADATLEFSREDVEERFAGAAHIRKGWASYLEDLREAGGTVSKTLESADAAALVARYETRFADGRARGGIETWRFDEMGAVVEHHVYGMIEPRPESDLVQRLRLLLSYPRDGLALLRGRRKD